MSIEYTDLDQLADEMASGETRTRALADQVLSDNVPLPVASVQGTDLSRFEGKVTFGDYSVDSDQQMSSWILTSWVGGALLDEHTEGATEQQFRWGHAWTMNPRQLALPPLARGYTPLHGSDVAISSGDARANGPLSIPLIEMGGAMYFSTGRNLKRLTGNRYAWGNMDFTRVGTLAGYPQHRAASIGRQTVELLGETLLFSGFMIPLGEDGVQLVTVTPAGTPDIQPVNTDVKAMAVVEWDNKVFALTTDGYLRRYLGVDAYTEWEAPNQDLRLPFDEYPRGLEVFYDRSGDQTVFIVTDKGLWAYDPDAQQIYRSSLTFPRHQNNGLGFCQWRDDALYISTGLGSARYTRDGVRTDMGLDREDGIPAEEFGAEWGAVLTNPKMPVPSYTILDMVGTQNFLAAIVQMGTRTVGSNLYGYYAVVVWNEAGWHVIHTGIEVTSTSNNAVAYPSRMLVTESVGGYRLWWGTAARKHSQDPPTGAATTVSPGLTTVAIPRDFHGPKHRVLQTVDEFNKTGWITTGWFDAGMKGFQKTFSHFEVYLKDPGDGKAVGGTVSVSYRTKSDPATWHFLGNATTYGRTVMPFGVEPDGFPRGITDSEIDFRIDLSSTTNNRSPIVEALILKFIKLPQPGRAWILNIPFDAENQYGMGPQEVDDYLAAKTYEGGFTKLTVGDRPYRVRYAQHQMVEGTGEVPFKTATVNVVTCPVPGDDDWGV